MGPARRELVNRVVNGSCTRECADGDGAQRQQRAGTVAPILAVGKTPFDLLRGSGGEEKVLNNA